MIPKRIQKKRPTNFKMLAAYVLAEKDGGRGEPVDWKLGEYVLDQAHAGEKVAWAHATNCEADDLGIAVKEILATQARNKTARTDKSYHLVVSFQEGERPTREQMEAIEQGLCDAIGLGAHQRVAAVHQNTDNWHMHIAINRVHPTTLRAIEPYYDHFRLQEAAQALEIEHDLIRDSHSLKPERALDGKASVMKAHAGRATFAKWVVENAAAPLVAAAAEAQTWQALHQAAAVYDIVIQPRGAGLIVAQVNGKGRMKASAVDASLSFKTLTDRLGPYEPLGTNVSLQPPITQYTGQPHGTSADVWARYQAERTAAMEARKTALALLRAGHLRYAEQMQQWYEKRYAAAKAQPLSFADKKSTYRRLDADKAADLARRKAMEKEDRQKIKDTHQTVTWAGFLARETSRGDKAASKALGRFVTGRIENERDGAGRD